MLFASELSPESIFFVRHFLCRRLHRPDETISVKKKIRPNDVHGLQIIFEPPGESLT